MSLYYGAVTFSLILHLTLEKQPFYPSYSLQRAQAVWEHELEITFTQIVILIVHEPYL